jgi:hypothetical protein
MNRRKVLKPVLNDCNLEEVASAIGVSLGSLNNRQLPYLPKESTQNFVDCIINFIDVTYVQNGKIILLKRIAEEFGLMLISKTTIHAALTLAIPKVSELFCDFWVLLGEPCKSHEEQIIEKHDAKRMCDKWEIIKRVTEEFVLACETGLYANEKAK